MDRVSVKAARILGGFTQEEMAESLGVHVQTYRKIENNPETATIAQADAIASKTGFGVNQIFFAADSTYSR